MNDFRKVAEPDDEAVTLSLWTIDGEPVGTMWGPTMMGGTGIVFDVAPQDGSMTAQQAYDGALAAAIDAQCEMVVVDPEGLWQKQWGQLTEVGSR